MCSACHSVESDTVVSPSVENNGPENDVIRFCWNGMSVMDADPRIVLSDFLQVIVTSVVHSVAVEKP